MLQLCLWKQKHLYECLITCKSDESTSKIGIKLLVFFTFFINCFIKTLIKIIIYCQTVLLEPFYLCMLRKLYVRLLCFCS